MAEIKTKVSAKALQPYMEKIIPLVASLRTEIENMPKCGKKESLMLSLVTIEKKTASHTKEISEEAAVAYINKHPEVLQRLAKMASSDEGLKEEADKIVTSEEKQQEQEQEQEKPKGDKKKKRF